MDKYVKILSMSPKDREKLHKARQTREKAAEIVMLSIIAAAICVLLYAFGHGIWRDYAKDSMHESGCCWCSMYKLARMDDPAFQTRELRRKGHDK